MPVALENEREYRLAEKDVDRVAARAAARPRASSRRKVAATLRAERLAQLNALKRLAARGKLGAGAGLDRRLPRLRRAAGRVRRPPRGAGAAARALPGRAAHRRRATASSSARRRCSAFQEPDGPQLIVCSTRVAGQGITLTRASNVAFLDLEWTPAMHDQAEDRCHRIGQHDAVTAWYLLAAETIDETMIELIARKRGIVGAVTDGRRDESEALVQSVVRELRGTPRRRLRVA